MSDLSKFDKTEQEKQVERERGPRDRFVPKEGYQWNPLNSYPRNNQCFCGSGIKFKKCHEGKMARCLPNNVAEDARKFMKGIIK